MENVWLAAANIDLIVILDDIGGIRQGYPVFGEYWFRFREATAAVAIYARIALHEPIVFLPFYQ